MTAKPGLPAQPPTPDVTTDDLREQVRQLLADGGTYRSIAAAAGLAPATVHDLSTGRRSPTPATQTALDKVQAGALPRARVDAGGTRLRQPTAGD